MSLKSTIKRTTKDVATLAIHEPTVSSHFSDNRLASQSYSNNAVNNDKRYGDPAERNESDIGDGPFYDHLCVQLHE